MGGMVGGNRRRSVPAGREAHAAGLADSPHSAIVNIIADMFNGFPGMAHTGAARAANTSSFDASV